MSSTHFLPAMPAPLRESMPQLVPLSSTSHPIGDLLDVAYDAHEQKMFIYGNGSVVPGHPRYADIHWRYSTMRQQGVAGKQPQYYEPMPYQKQAPRSAPYTQQQPHYRPQPMPQGQYSSVAPSHQAPQVFSNAWTSQAGATVAAPFSQQQRQRQFSTAAAAQEKQEAAPMDIGKILREAVTRSDDDKRRQRDMAMHMNQAPIQPHQFEAPNIFPPGQPLSLWEQRLMQMQPTHMLQGDRFVPTQQSFDNTTAPLCEPASQPEPAYIQEKFMGQQLLERLQLQATETKKMLQVESETAVVAPVATIEPSTELGNNEQQILQIMSDFERTGLVQSPFILREIEDSAMHYPNDRPLYMETRRLLDRAVIDFMSKEKDVLEFLKKRSDKQLAMVVLFHWINSEVKNEVEQKESLDVSQVTLAALQLIAATCEETSETLRMLMGFVRSSYKSKKETEPRKEINFEDGLRNYVNWRATRLMNCSKHLFANKEKKEEDIETSKRFAIRVRIAELEQEIQEKMQEAARLRQELFREDSTDAVAAAEVGTITSSSDSVKEETEELQQAVDSDVETAWEMSDYENETEEEDSSEDDKSDSEEDEIEWVKNPKNEADEEDTDEDSEEDEDEEEEENEKEREETVYANVEVIKKFYKEETIVPTTPTNPIPSESVQPLQSAPLQPVEVVKQYKEDTKEAEKERKIKKKIAELKNISFWEIMASFEVKMEEIEDKMDDMEERIEEIEEENDDMKNESRLDEIEERLEKIEKRIEDAKPVLL